MILKDPFFQKALLKGAAAGVEHQRILESLENCRFVVDIGANRGQFSLVVRRIFPSAKIHAIEPLHEPGQIFKKVFLRDDLVEFHPCAIGRERADATIHVSFDDDSSSLLPISEAQVRLYPRTAEKEVRKVTIIPLRDLLDGNTILPPALLKIDVQGFELESLRGCEPLLDCFQYVYVECSFIELYEGQALASEIMAYLAKHGFSLVGVYNMGYDRAGYAIQGDFLFSIGERAHLR